MKRLTLAVLLAATLGCDSSDSPIRLLRALNVGGTSASQCSGESTRTLLSGRLDVDAYATQYLLALQVESRLAPPQLVLGDRNLATPNINDATLQTLELTYRWSPRKPVSSLPEKEELSIYFIVPAGVNREGNVVLINGIGPRMMGELMTRLNGGALVVPPTNGPAPEFFTLFVDLQLKGELGGGRTISTNQITWPILLTNNYGFNPSSCNPATTYDRILGPCGQLAGQDNYLWACPGPAQGEE
jgi:hypothetical protein